MVTHLIERHYGGDLLDAVRVVYKQLEGHFAFVVIHKEHPNLLVGARLQCPLVVGVGDGEMFLASSIAAFQRETSRVKLIEDGEVVEITPAGARFVSTDDEERDRDELIIEWDDESAERQGYETFMLKEIYEQPYAVERTLEEYIVDGEVRIDLGLSDEDLAGIERVLILACGTAYHAGVVGRYAIEEWARIPCEFDVASEWIYRNPVVPKNTLVIGISQSGETRDTVQAVQLAKELGAHTRRGHEPPGHAAHARGGERRLHARRHGDGRRRDEDLHDAGDRALPARPAARRRRAARWPPRRSEASSPSSRACP